MAAPTFTVGELIDQANVALAGMFPGEVWVEGEIHNKGRPSAAGHTYFSLVEARTDPLTGRKQNATINVALFNKARDRVKRKSKTNISDHSSLNETYLIKNKKSKI